MLPRKTFFNKQSEWKALAQRGNKGFIPAVTLQTYTPALSRFIDSDESYEGSLFTDMFREALEIVDLNVHNMIVVNSFNNWHEDTQIEPLEDGLTTNKDKSPNQDYFTQGLKYRAYGTRYLDILQDETKLTLSHPSKSPASSDQSPTAPHTNSPTEPLKKSPTDSPIKSATKSPMISSSKTPSTVPITSPTTTPTIPAIANPTFFPSISPTKPLKSKSLVAVYYYPWYAGENFHGRKYLLEMLLPPQLPELGEYNDRDPEVLARHVEWCLESNIQVLVSSWWGPGSSTDVTAL